MATGGESNPELYRFRCSLLKVSQKLRIEEVKELVYICTEIKSTEHIAKGHDLFLDLETKGLITPGNYDYLLDRLLQIGREDIVTYLLEHIFQSSHAQWGVSNKMLDRLLKAGREEVALHLMEWMCKTLHTPSTFPAHLMQHLINSGRGDLVMELMGRMSCLHLPRGLQTEQQTMQVVYHAKQSMCTSHQAALSMLLFPNSPLSVQMNSVLVKYHRELRQSADIHTEATFIEWTNLPSCKSSNRIEEILSSTLENIYSFADAYREMMTNIYNIENVDVDRIRKPAKTCNSMIDDFDKVHTITQWNPSEREEVLHLRNTRKFPGAVHVQTAVKSICSICEGVLCNTMIEKAEARVSDTLFLLETPMYVPWCSVPMYQWMRTVIQLAASSKLDLTKYRDIIVKVATEHREPIVQYHNELSQIIGHDAMRKVDLVLKIDEHEITTSMSDATLTTTKSVQNSFDVAMYLTVYCYAYLLRLLTLVCDCSANTWEMASKMAEHHCSFHKTNYKNASECAMKIARKIFLTIYAEVETFKAELIQQCPQSSAERMLLSGLLTKS